jgi:hypothetical protein
VAPSHGVHDYSPHLVYLFFDWLPHLSCTRWGEILRIHWLARWDLLSDAGLPRSLGVCDAAVGHFDACSSLSSPLGPAQAGRALDDPNLALRVCHRSSCLFNALPMVPSAATLNDEPANHSECQNLALDGDLMFDHSHMPPRMKESLW